jgi:hypothetical protein
MSNKKAPAETPISTRAKLTSAEAERTLDKFIIRRTAVELNRRFHSDLPFLPDRM